MIFLRKLFSCLVIVSSCYSILLISNEQKIDAIIQQALEGFFSEVSFLPEEEIGLIILTNSSTDVLPHLLYLGEFEWTKYITGQRHS